MVNEIMSIYSMLWVDWAWFPANQTWHSLDRVYPDGPFYPQSYDLLLVIPIAFFLIGVRFLVERYILLNLTCFISIINRKFYFLN